MAFDKNLDKELFSESVNFTTSRITVSIFAYNEGTPKLQISRENLSNTTGQYSFSKLGRLTKEEAVAILPIVQKAVSTMN